MARTTTHLDDDGQIVNYTIRKHRGATDAHMHVEENMLGVAAGKATRAVGRAAWRAITKR